MLKKTTTNQIYIEGVLLTMELIKKLDAYAINYTRLQKLTFIDDKEPPDIVQQSLIKLINGVRNLSINPSYSLMSRVQAVVRSELRDEAKKIWTKGRKPKRSFFENELERRMKLHDEFTPETDDFQQKVFKKFKEEIIRRDKPYEIDILNLLLQEYSFPEIEEKLNLPFSLDRIIRRFYRVIDRILDSFKKE